MKKELVALFLLLVFLSGCTKAVIKEKPVEKLDDLQTTACQEADKARTCQTRLVEIGIVLPNECCETLGVCCEK